MTRPCPANPGASPRTTRDIVAGLAARLVRMPAYQRLLRRFLPAEAAGTVCALLGAWTLQHATASPWAAGWAASIAELIGYYSVIVIADARRVSRSTRQSLARTVPRILPGVVVEFGPAEVLDSLVVRPLLMGAGPLLTGDLVSGTVLGKLAADAVFYALVLPGGWLRKRLSARRTSRAGGAGDLVVGDQVRIGVAGAYTVQYASEFNGFAIPAIHYPAANPAHHQAGEPSTAGPGPVTAKSIRVT